MPNALHRAERQIIHGDGVARLAGKAMGGTVGLMLAGDGVFSSADALDALPHAVAGIKPGVLAVTQVTHPLSRVGRAAADALVSRVPALGYGLYLPAKAADVASAAYGVLVDGQPGASERLLAQRQPFASYPAWCNPARAQAGCPDPMAWARAASITPYLFGAAALAGGVWLGGRMGLWSWHTLSPAIAKLPADLTVPCVPPEVTVAGQSMIRYAQRANADLAWAREQQEQSGRAAEAASAAAAGQHLPSDDSDGSLSSDYRTTSPAPSTAAAAAAPSRRAIAPAAPTEHTRLIAPDIV